jgi:hypothetical protein
MNVEVHDDEVSLLDRLLVVAENLKLLVFGSLFGGVLALGVSYVLPLNYVSHAILLIPSTNSTNWPNAPNSAQVAAMMKSPLVLDQLVAMHPELKGKPIEVGRKELAEQIKAVVDKKDGLLRLDVIAKKPEDAQHLANALIDTWLKTTPPGPEDRADLEKRLLYAVNGLAAVTQVLKSLGVDGPVTLSKPLTRGEVGTSFVGLGELHTRYLNDVLGIPRALQGFTREVVKQPPTLPTEPTSNTKTLIAVVAALGTGFVLLLFVFLRQAWQKVGQDPEGARKLERLRSAFGQTT